MWWTISISDMSLSTALLKELQCYTIAAIALSPRGKKNTSSETSKKSSLKLHSAHSHSFCRHFSESRFVLFPALHSWKPNISVSAVLDCSRSLSESEEKFWIVPNVPHVQWDVEYKQHQGLLVVSLLRIRSTLNVREHLTICTMETLLTENETAPRKA